jgi:hypothetical protein
MNCRRLLGLHFLVSSSVQPRDLHCLVTLSLGQSDMSEPRITGVSLVLVMGRQGSWCPALCREVLLDVVLSCVSHGPSLG